MDLKMKDKVALVTGSSSGIGRATAIVFAQEGAKVVVSGRNEERCKAVVDEIKAAGGEASYFVADVTVEEEVKALVDFTVQTYGRLDYAFNNAGISGRGSGKSVHQAAADLYRETYETNCLAVATCMRYEIPYMLENGKGAIVNNCSANSLAVNKYGSVYAHAKYAVYGLTRAAAMDYADQNIRINGVGPGITDTPMIEGLMKSNPEKGEVVDDTNSRPKNRRP